MSRIDTELDVRGLKSPAPILHVRATLKGMLSSTVLKIIGADSDSVKDIESFCHQTDNQLLSSVVTAETQIILIRKR